MVKIFPVCMRKFCNMSVRKICVFLFANCVFIFRIANTFVASYVTKYSETFFVIRKFLAYSPSPTSFPGSYARNIDYFMVDECVRFLFTRCERLLTHSFAALTRSLVISHNSWIKIVRTRQPWSNLYFLPWSKCSL